MSDCDQLRCLQAGWIWLGEDECYKGLVLAAILDWLGHLRESSGLVLQAAPCLVVLLHGHDLAQTSVQGATRDPRGTLLPHVCTLMAKEVD